MVVMCTLNINVHIEHTHYTIIKVFFYYSKLLVTLFHHLKLLMHDDELFNDDASSMTNPCHGYITNS